MPSCTAATLIELHIIIAALLSGDGGSFRGTIIIQFKLDASPVV